MKLVTSDEKVDRLLDSLDKQSKQNAMLYRALQIREAVKTPDATIFQTVKVACELLGANPLPFQIIGQQHKRFELSIVNNGPSDIFLAAENFDPTSIFQQLSDPNETGTLAPGGLQIVSVAIIESGQNWTGRTASGLWAYNIGATASPTPLDATLSISGTSYLTASSDPSLAMGLDPHEQLHGLVLFSGPGAEIRGVI